MEPDASMNARARAREDAPAVGLDGVPLPIVHADYEIDSREFQNSQAYGTDDLDTQKAEEATRAVNRKEEAILWNGLDMSINTDRGAFSIDGLDTDTEKVIQNPGSDGWQDPEVVLQDIKEKHDLLEQQEGKEDLDAGPMPSETGATLFVPRRKWGYVTREDYETEATDEPLL
ncbi:major capsid protein, partial [Cryptosporangium minutisporangium]|uniref:major capsid protein n=1 Tax=Cryptosporangium minutisporangium TaxID=113569 RepID=UPI0035EE30D3